MEPLNLHKEIELIENRLHELYRAHNEAPRLISEMLQKFPNPRGKTDSVRGLPMTHNLG